MKFTILIVTLLTMVSLSQGLSLAQIEWETVNQMGRISLGRHSTREDWGRVGEIAKAARQRLGFDYVADLLAHDGQPAFQQHQQPAF